MPENIIKTNKSCWIINNPDFDNAVNSQWFDDKYWLNQGRLLGASSGRGSAWMIKADNQKMMLRHYYRGGIPAKIIKDKYLWTGLDRTRSFSEFRLLNIMSDLNLPVPKPISAQVCKKGLFYLANILIEYIPHDFTFAQTLNLETQKTIWQEIGSTIADFHHYGINHADLNANNILIGEKVHLIDFDHSFQVAVKRTWRYKNLKRLKRSIDKLTKQEFKSQSKQLWDLLLNAYEIKFKENERSIR
jgi:3-deoxy-D-manno-octulosonic acid kinase